MGRRKGPSKAEQRRARAEGLTRNEFFEFVGTAKAARQELDDATMEHAGVFKKGDSMGVHLGAVKLFLQLDKMEDTKRADFLRAFDTYREWAEHWTAQPDLMEVSEEHAAAESDSYRPEDGTADGDTESDREPAPLTADDETKPPVEETVEKLESDWGELTEEGGQPELERAGFVYAEGQKAGADGHSADQNPHAATSPLHAIWERGRNNPNNPAAAEPESDAEVVELDAAAKPGRRRRNRHTDAETAAALH